MSDNQINSGAPEEANRPLRDSTLEGLSFLRGSYEASIANLKDWIAQIDAELNARFAEDFQAAFAAGDKLSGQVTVERDGLKITGEISKTVKWDSKALMAVAATLPWERTAKLFKIEFSVPEATFNAITDEDLQKKIAAARTVKYGELKVKLGRKE